MPAAVPTTEDFIGGDGEAPTTAAGAAPTAGGQTASTETSWTDSGWKDIPVSNIGSGTSRAWNGTRGWFNYSGNVATAEPDAWASYNRRERDSDAWSSRKNDADDDWNAKERRKNKDGDVPDWDGKSMHRTVYFRKIDLWTATTGVVPEEQAVRLLQKLSGEAFEKLENVKVEDVKCTDGVEKFKEYIINAYEPIEDYRVGKIMDEFLDDFQRKKDQEIVDYNRSWFSEISKAEKVAGELQPKWKAHLYLRKMRLSPYQKSQVLTGSLGDYTVEGLGKAALRTFPNVKEAFGHKGTGLLEHRGFGARGDKHPKRGGFRRGGGKGGFRKRAHKANEVDQESDEEDEEENPGEHDEESSDSQKDSASSDGEGSKEAGAEGELPPEVPHELEEAYQESRAFLTRAKKQRREVEKARDFFKKGPKGQGKDGDVKTLKMKMPSAKCGALGHWYTDKL